jgi:hypothetical protein
VAWSILSKQSGKGDAPIELPRKTPSKVERRATRTGEFGLLTMCVGSFTGKLALRGEMSTEGTPSGFLGSAVILNIFVFIDMSWNHAES